MKPPTIPSIELSPETGTITNALDLVAWLRNNSTNWSHIEDVARHHQMSRIERLELLALTFGLALERAKQDAVERELRYLRPVFVTDPFATPLDEGFEICDATFVPPESQLDRLLRIHKDQAESNPQLKTYTGPGRNPEDSWDFGIPDTHIASGDLDALKLSPTDRRHVVVPMDYSLPSHEQTEARLNRIDPEALPGTVKPKDPADLAPAIFIGLGLFFAIAAGVLGMTGHGLAAALCGVTSILSLVRASKYPA